MRARNSRRDVNSRYTRRVSHVTKSGTFGTYQYQSVTLIERAHVLYKKRDSHTSWWKFLTTCFGPLFERGTTSTCHCGARTACIKNGLSPLDGHSQISALAHSRKRHYLVLVCETKAFADHITTKKVYAVVGYLFLYCYKWVRWVVAAAWRALIMRDAYICVTLFAYMRARIN